MFKFIKRRIALKKIHQIEFEMEFINSAIKAYEDIIKESEKSGKHTNIAKDAKSKLVDLELRSMMLEHREYELLKKLC